MLRWEMEDRGYYLGYSGDEEAARNKLGIFLSSVSTMKKLKELWPEGEPFWLQLSDTPRTLPAIPISEINNILGLPKTEPGPVTVQ